MFCYSWGVLGATMVIFKSTCSGSKVLISGSSRMIGVSLCTILGFFCYSGVGSIGYSELLPVSIILLLESPPASNLLSLTNKVDLLLSFMAWFIFWIFSFLIRSEILFALTLCWIDLFLKILALSKSPSYFYFS